MIYKLNNIKVNTTLGSSTFLKNLLFLPSPDSTPSYLSFPIENATQRFHLFTTLTVPSSGEKLEISVFNFICTGLPRKLISPQEGFCSSELTQRNERKNKTNKKQQQKTYTQQKNTCIYKNTQPNNNNKKIYSSAASNQFAKLFFLYYSHFITFTGLRRNQKYLRF